MRGQTLPASETDKPAPQQPAPDIFFLTERVSIVTKSGVVGLAPGTRVRLISRNGNTFRLTDGGDTFDVSSDKLTTDAEVAARLGQNDATGA